MQAEQTNPAQQAPRQWVGRAFCLFGLILMLAVTVMLAVGGRPDPAGRGQPLDGAWRFHAGDDPTWASPGLDDHGWDRIMLVSQPENRDGDVGIPGYLDGWRARGHPDHEGYGWYRRQVTAPSGDLVLIGPPSVDDGYEMFWNGRPIGGVGRLSGEPKVNTTRPFIASLPAAGSDHAGVLAIRTFMQPGVDRDGHSGGLRTVPVLAPRADGEALYSAQWRRTIAGYVVDAAEPLAMLVLAIIAIILASRLARPSFARWAALALVASAGLRLGNAISAWTDLVSLPALLWQNDLILAPLAKLGWTMAWNRWTNGRDTRWVSWAAAAAWGISVAGAFTHGSFLADTGRALFALSLAAIVIRILRHGQHRIVALPALLLTVAGLFAADLSALGIPSIWFPFGIGVSRSQYAYALALPLLAWVLAAADARSSTPRPREPAAR